MTQTERAELRQEIQTAVAAAVSAAMSDHSRYCRFTDAEAQRLHQVPEDLDRRALFDLGRMARAWDTASKWIGRVILVAFLALLVWGLSKLGTMSLEVPKP